MPACIGYIVPYDSSDAANSRADYAHHITASPPGFENPAASLIVNIGLIKKF